jgi:hypothetical protein
MSNAPRLALSLMVGGALGSACGGRSTASPPETRPIGTTEAPLAVPNDVVPVGAAPTTTTWEVHEWGLVDASLASGQLRVAAGPALRPQRPMATRKPVLYIHLGPGLETQAFTARVKIPGGAIAEMWPNTELTPDGLVWKDVRATAGTCAARGVQPLRDAPPACDSRDRMCELDELPRYVTDDAACLTTAHGEAPLLFYRGTATPRALPLGVTLTKDGTVDVRPLADMKETPGTLIRIAMPCRGPVVPGETMAVAVAAVPGPEGTTIPYPSQPADRTALRAQLAKDLADQGLTPSEAKAFLDAWMDELFGAGADTQRENQRRLAPIRPMSDALIYWMPAATIDTVATLTFEPRPTAVRRAMLVRVDLGMTCAATGGPAVPE